MNSDPVVLSTTLSDSVIREMGTNKLSLIGCFHSLHVPNVPFMTPVFYITVALTNFKGKLSAPKTVTVRIEDPTNAVVIANVSGHVGAQSEYEFTGAEVVEFPFSIMPFLVPHAGRYVIDVLIDGDKTSRRDLMVHSITGQIQLPPKNPN